MILLLLTLFQQDSLFKFGKLLKGGNQFRKLNNLLDDSCQSPGRSDPQILARLQQRNEK